ncbi:alpha/beta hydrolase family protein [Chitinophaga sp. RAB17]|uniref:alpha/beta hydrolase family protein n=1 Tax=Chitinophaga sp. RAB17 TaxID=3233049 RepID=UPI003F939146
MKKVYQPLLLLFLSAGFLSCNNNNGGKTTEAAQEALPAFADSRKGFVTKLTQHNKMDVPVPQPPKELFSIVAYPSDIGNMEAYLGKIPDSGKLHPAIIWISGGFGNDIGGVWEEADPENDQTAGAFRKAGIVMMYPAQRGGNRNPGYDESGFGEIDDILAAADFLAKQPGIDSNRIYLGGHSTGGTKVLLAAECSKRFRAVFSFGPVQSYDSYGPESCTFNTQDSKESLLRSPASWLSSLQTPVYVFEGDGQGNIEELRAMKKKAAAGQNKYTHFYEVKNKDHFSALQPVCKIAAQKILEDDKPGAVNMDFEEEIAAIQ